MAVFDDERLLKTVALKPFRDWLMPPEYGREAIIIPEERFVETEPVAGGMMIRDKQVQRELRLERGLHITEIGQKTLTGEQTFRVSGLLQGPNIYSNMTPDLKEALDAQHREYAQMMKGTIDPEVQAILRDNKRRLAEGGAFSVWEIDMELTEQEMVLYDLARPERKAVTLSEKFEPKPKEDPELPVLLAEILFLQERVRAMEALLAVEGLRQDVNGRLMHEAVNVYGLTGTFAPYLSATWWMFIKELIAEMQEFRNIHESKDSLKDTLYDRLEIEPAESLGEDGQYLQGARYEFPKWGGEFKYVGGKLEQVDNPLAFIDFLAGFPYGCCEMLVMVGEVTTKKENWPSYPDENESPVPPVPDGFFEKDTYTEQKTAHDVNWLESDKVETFANGLDGEKEPESPNWWVRVNFEGDETYPYPGEFVGLGVRIFPNLTWGKQKYSPFLYGGHWFDTVFLTSAEAMVVEKHGDGYYLCEVNWRKEEKLKVYPVDFAEHKEGDRVTIMKDIKVAKTSQLWNDEDCFKFDEEVWRIVPLTYYGKGFIP